jgi:pilus assembly protein CpaB
VSLKAIAAAVVLALLALVSLGMYTRRLEIEASGGERVSVLLIAKPMKKGTTISEATLSVREVPIAYVDERFVRASDRGKVVGVRLEHDVDTGHVLLWGDVAVSGAEERHLSQLVQPGSRALTLQIPQSYMSIQMLRPGDYVDIVGVLGEASRQSAIVILQKVLVLAVGQETMPNRDSNTAINSRLEQLLTVSVTLQESQSIALAAQKGPVYAVLRSPDDQSVADKVPAVSQVVPVAPGGKTAVIAARDQRPQKLVREP